MIKLFKHSYFGISMLTHSFCFLPGIGKKKEEALWKQGILTWEQFLQAKEIQGIWQKQKYDALLQEAKQKRRENDSSYFAYHFPPVEIWRLYADFKEEALFLDIEADGKGPFVIGLFDKEKTMTMVRGVNMEKEILFSAFEGKKVLVSFNGKSCDIPRINRYFGIMLPELPHIDLRHMCPRAGLCGGLKDVEKQINIQRTYYGSPTDAWKAFFASGDREYLDLIIKYNEEDVVNLYPLMEYVYSQFYEKWKKEKAT